MANNVTSREFAGPGLVEQFLSSLYKGAKADLNLFKKGWVATGGAMEDAGKAFFKWATTPAQPPIPTTAQEAMRAVSSAKSQEEVYGPQVFPPLAVKPTPSGVAVLSENLGRAPGSLTEGTFEVPGTTIMGEAPVAPLAEGPFVTAGQGQGWGQPGTGTKGVYESPEEKSKWDKDKWNDVIAGLAALAKPKDLPTPTLNLNQIQPSTVQGGGGQRTPFNPDAVASTAFKDRTTAPQILKFLR